MKLLLNKYPGFTKYLIIIYIIGFSIGTITHSIDLICIGFPIFETEALWKNIYWASLTFFDFLVIVLIFTKPKAALILANIIMISDVLINTESFTYFDDYKIIMQIVFALYIMNTSPFIYKELINE